MKGAGILFPLLALSYLVYLREQDSGMDKPIRKIILAPDSFKGTLSAAQVCGLLKAVVLKYFPECEVKTFPMSDGGEGFLDAMLLAAGGKKTRIRVTGPLGSEIDADYGVLADGRVVIEMAAASGLTLLGEHNRDAFNATSYGTGQLMRHALQQGYRDLIIGLGGSATVDGGAGAAAALGVSYRDTKDNEIRSGAGLISLTHIDLTQMEPGLRDAKITFAVDVTNPLYGENGAARIFGPQKGASPDQVFLLDRGLENLGRLLEKRTGLDLQKLPGSGAAGGLASPFVAFAAAKIESGIQMVMDAYQLDAELENCDLVVTGEGCTDAQSVMGKVLSGIGNRGLSRKVPVIAISGMIADGYQAVYGQGISAVFSTVRSADDLINISENAEARLQSTAEDVLRLIKDLWGK